MANARGLAALGHVIDERSGGRRQRRTRVRKSRSRARRLVTRGAITLGVVVVLLVGAVVGDYYYLGSLVKRQRVGNLQSAGASVNILLIGSTTRCGLAVQNQAYGTCAEGVTGVNSDIDMIVHLDPATHAVSLLSIPRDTFVPNARIAGANKIDAALYEGPSQLVAAIEEDFGIPINHYVELNFDTFASVVNALGGVRMYFPMPVFDAYSGLYVPHPGCISLDGYHALQVVRARHLQIQTNPAVTNRADWTYEALSDIARIRRTHEFLRVLGAKVAARGLGNPLTDQSIAQSVLPDLTVDTGFSEGTMVSLAATFAHTNIANVAQETFPVVGVNSPYGYQYKGYSYGSIVFPVEPTGYSLIDQLFGVSIDQSPFTGRALPAPGSFKISVENGSGITNQATTVAAAFTAKGYRVASIGDRTPTGPIPETVVWYGGAAPPLHADWKNPGLEAAQSVMSQIEGPAIMGYNPSLVTPGALVTVQTGVGLTLKPTTPPASTTTTTPVANTSSWSPPSSSTSSSLGGFLVQMAAGSSSLTTTTTVPDPVGIATNPALGTPSATNPGLKPWDPRACNAAGTGPAPTP
ncbi:MAG: LCP family protein [Acidobacteriota bacterium]|nr:LCP family protein [Acidobacteriota bacterium]MDE3030554.1 LCP family protein [Acidobacteriota bacterium]MDE3093015.1 LCP family protein [Acidobacteriota bacterium]MDE3139183.1 LCP family protein [Acidobacteriota bacterium]